jgi:predicted HTH domain antitoxin
MNAPWTIRLLAAANNECGDLFTRLTEDLFFASRAERLNARLNKRRRNRRSPQRRSPGAQERLSCRWAIGRSGGNELLYGSTITEVGAANMKLEIDVDLPREILDQIPSAELAKLCETEIVLRLYSERKLAAVEAARLLGLTRIRFLDLLRERGVGFLVDLDDEDFRQLDTLR